MEEILSFGELMGEARLRGFKLELFREGDGGLFECAWRKDGVVHKTVQRRQSFTALHDAFFAAVAAAKGEVAPVEPQTDLFEQGGGNDARPATNESETDLFG